MATSITSSGYPLCAAKLKASSDNVRLYLRDIGRSPLLTPEQELQLGREVQTMVRLEAVKDQLAQSCGEEPSMETWTKAADLEIAELQTLLEKGHKAKQKMITANLRLVVTIAKKYRDRNLELLDLIQEGTLGLERAAEKYDPQRGFRFSTYAYWWIRQGITRAIAEQGRTIRLPIHLTEALNKIKRTQRELSQSLGRSPTTAEVAQALSLTPEKVQQYLHCAHHTLSIDLKIGDDQDSSIVDFIEAPDSSPEKFVSDKTLSESLQMLLATLTPQQREVLTLRYGLIDGRELTLAAVGRRMDISRERVRQLQNAALSQLQKRKPEIADYLVS
ncbi:RNA polymerase sigma factor, RpoD/SigA family [Acaryochloris sp. CCMEE 5410]|uniref:RNA polymerase sigma factor, RpoD/SigA family n=1 Tax=Acaryochloris sp. CCMEE 5410 TaxID=310037 RepID=UPI0002483F74|nr:RNA polymerase sigma factor, RpoD/SigA family [Acaryochloris sp. CCMEE 5410]KAI9134420.1 RNA polymerase sigma factor, RpoD/SigA family [Acaryochloris sp. CCMEE 5410]